MRSRPTGAGRGSVVRVFFLAFVVYAYFMPRWADWNIDSRLDLTHAMVDGHTLRIDAYHQNTWDKATFDGHFYSDKAPGTALLGAGVYGLFVLARAAPLTGQTIRAVERSSAWAPAIRLGRTNTQAAPAARGTSLAGCQRTGGAGNVQYIPWGNRLVPPLRDWALSKYVVSVGAVSFFSALFAAFFFWFLSLFAVSRMARWLLTLLYAFATVALPYSTVFYSHQLVAGALFTAFALLYLLSRRMVRSWAVPAAGFLLGFAFFTEYTVALAIVVIGLYGLWAVRARVRRVASMTAAGAVPVAGLFAYNYACFGNPLDTGYSHDYCWSSAQGAGFAGFTYPHLGPLFDLTLGPFRGLFFASPFLLLAIPGLLLMRKRALGPEALVCAVTVVLFILAISAYWGWNGGKVDGPRYLVPIVPFCAFPVVFALDRMLGWTVGRVAVAALAGWSIFACWSGLLGGELFPTAWHRNPLFQDSLPELAGNQIAPNAGLFLGLQGWQTLLPLVALVILVLVVGRPSELGSRLGGLSLVRRERLAAQK